MVLKPLGGCRLKSAGYGGRWEAWSIGTWNRIELICQIWYHKLFLLDHMKGRAEIRPLLNATPDRVYDRMHLDEEYLYP